MPVVPPPPAPATDDERAATPWEAIAVGQGTAPGAMGVGPGVAGPDAGTSSSATEALAVARRGRMRFPPLHASHDELD